jgi:signal transduction histidine kinase
MDKSLMQTYKLKASHTLPEHMVAENSATQIGLITLSIIHEIAQPLNCLHYHIDQLKDAKDSKERIELIKNELLRLQELTQHLLNIRNPAQEKHLSLQKISATITQLFSWQLAAESIHLTTSWQKDSASCEVPERRLMQILINLLNNSLRALKTLTTNRKVHLSFSQTTDFVCVSVWNNGPALDVEQKKIMITDHLTTNLTLSGLGLRVCNHLALEQNGHITFSSEENYGTEFTYWLPISACKMTDPRAELPISA